jgi:predicted RNase H-like HicB family nuclease
MMIIIKEDKGYNASFEVEIYSNQKEGKTYDELITNILEAVNLAPGEEGITYPLMKLHSPLT